MARDDTEARIRRLIAMVLQNDLPGDVPLARDRVAEWDSLKHVEILFALEDEFGVRFDEDELARLDSLESLTDSVERHRAP